MNQTGPRHGPKQSGAMTIWTRRIAGHDWIFWAWPDALAVYRETPHGQPLQLVHYFRKETAPCPFPR